MRRIASLLVLLAACSGPHASMTADVKYGKTGEDDYQKGEKEAEAHNWAEAQKYFEHVKNKFPYSRFAPLSELRLADLKFEQDRFIEAADAYQQFVKLHPSHEKVDYAAYRAALSHWKEGPSDFFIMPPAYEKDEAQTRSAVTAYQAFLKDYPRSQYAEPARKELAEAQDQLAEHEWYVAQFYRKRDRWAGVVVRLEGLVRDYPGSRHETEALLELARAYLRLDERYRAQQTLQQLIVKHPKDPRRAEAEKLLAAIR